MLPTSLSLLAVAAQTVALIVALATARGYRRMADRQRGAYLALEHAIGLLGERAARLLRDEADRFEREVGGDSTAVSQRFDSVAALVGLRRQLDPDLAMAERDALALVAEDREATRARRAALIDAVEGGEAR